MSERGGDERDRPIRVIVVGAGFGGLGCARELAKHDDVHVTLIDQHNYQQFMPLLYQVATSQLNPSDVALNIRRVFHKRDNVDVTMAGVVDADATATSVTLDDGQQIDGDFLVLAAGSRPNFFGTPGAEEHAFPLYSLSDAERLRSRILQVFESADRDRSLADRGALTFVVVGSGPTGTEIAGALAELIAEVMPSEYHDLDVSRARVILVDRGDVVLGAFSEKAHAYAAEALQKDGVELQLGVGVEDVAVDHVTLSDGSTIPTRCVIWGGGLQAVELTGALGLPVGKGDRLDIEPDLTVAGHPGTYAVGDIANIVGADGAALPQLGSVALQSGQWAAANIRADIDGKDRTPFRYHDKGIMAMIGRNAAVAEVGEHRHELHGPIAFSAWLGVHVVLLSGVRHRVDAFVSWAWDYFTKNRASQVLDRPDEVHIRWDSDDEDAGTDG